MISPSDTARQYSRAHAERFRQDPQELLRIPSLSGDPAYSADGQRDGQIYARGVSDDSGQMFVHVRACESYMKVRGAAPVNLREEEPGSHHLSPFLRTHLASLKADLRVISDSPMRVIEEPVILHSLRGMTSMEIVVQRPSDDLHSGAGHLTPVQESPYAGQ